MFEYFSGLPSQLLEVELWYSLYCTHSPSVSIISLTLSSPLPPSPCSLSLPPLPSPPSSPCCSYKLWYNYLKLRRTQVKSKCITDPAYESVNSAFERSLVFMHKVGLHTCHISHMPIVVGGANLVKFTWGARCPMFKLRGGGGYCIDIWLAKFQRGDRDYGLGRGAMTPSTPKCIPDHY